MSKAKKRRVECVSRVEAAQSLLELSEAGNGSSFCEPHTGVSVMTDLSMEDLKELEDGSEEKTSTILEMEDEICSLVQQNERLTADCKALKAELELKTELELQATKSSKEDPEPFGKKFYEDSNEKAQNEKVKYYTGLPSYKMLVATYKFVLSGLVNGSRTSLSPFQQFLIKLRLNLGDQDIAFRFNVSQSTVTRHIQKWIDILYIRLGPLVKWPDRGEMLRTMPMSFRKSYG